MSLRNLVRAAMVLATASISVLVAAPAQASTLSVGLSCEPTTARHVLCISSVSGGTGPYSRRWYYNDRYFPTQDDRITTSWSCTPGAVNQYRIAVIDANFELVFQVTGSGCNSGNV